jgi:integrase
VLLKEAVEYIDQSAPGRLASPRRHNSHVAAWGTFLTWALPGAKRGGADILSRTERSQEREWVKEFFSERRVGRKGRSFTALSDEEMVAIEDRIGPVGVGSSFPTDVFAKSTRLRNWLLFGLIRWTGIRRGEALKFSIDDLPEQLPDGSFRHFGMNGRYQPGAEIYVRRRNDDPEDSRARQPGVKRRGRSVVIPDGLARDLCHYRDTPLAMGGRLGATTPYFFVTRTGQPISISTMVGISRRITKYMRELMKDESAAPFTWHRLRHSLACDLFPMFWNKGDSGLQEFMDLFGWEDPKSIQIYTDMVRHVAASQSMRAYERSLFS